MINKDALKKAPFWRNDVIGAYCLNETVEPNPKDSYGTFDLSYWIGFYDEDAKAYKGKTRLKCSSYGGMCHYSFKEFFNPNEIENEYDLQLQEKLLERINQLLDDKIVEIRKD